LFFVLDTSGAFKWALPWDDCLTGSPAIGPDGTVYVGSYDGYFYALRGSAPLADSPWPKVRCSSA